MCQSNYLAGLEGAISLEVHIPDPFNKRNPRRAFKLEGASCATASAQLHTLEQADCELQSASIHMP